MEKIAKGYSLFINWFNGVCAFVCGGWMMLSALIDLPLNWQDFMPLSIYDNFPFHDVFFTSHFWPGLALLLVNGVANVIALVLRSQGDQKGWRTFCLIAGVLLIVWTAVEMILVPNPLSVFYMVLGVLQTGAAILMICKAK